VAGKASEREDAQARNKLFSPPQILEKEKKKNSIYIFCIDDQNNIYII
jgi:hypothetical protein